MRKEKKSSSLAKIVQKAGSEKTSFRSIAVGEDGNLVLNYSLSKVELTLGGIDPHALEFVESHFLDENERAWLRIVNIMDLALTNPGITNNSHAAEFCRIFRQLAVCARGDSTIDEVLAPLKTAGKSMHASDVASKKNAKERAWTVQQWYDRTDQGQSKAAFARQYQLLVKKKFDLDVTTGTIERDWLPKG